MSLQVLNYPDKNMYIDSKSKVAFMLHFVKAFEECHQELFKEKTRQ